MSVGAGNRAVPGMSLSEPFIRRPVATTLLSVGVALAGAQLCDDRPARQASYFTRVAHRSAQRPSGSSVSKRTRPSFVSA